MRLSALFEGFSTYLRVERRASPGTLKVYREKFNDFVEFVQGKLGGIVTTNHLTEEMCRAYYYGLDGRHLQPATMRLHLTVLSSFSRWLVRGKKLAANPIEALTKPRLARRPPRGIPAWHVVDDVLAGRLTPRDRAIIALLAYGGLRRSEVVALDVGDFDPAFGLRRVQGKGGTVEAVALPPNARRIVSTYLATERTGAKAGEPMFLVRYVTVGLKRRQDRMASDRVYEVVKALGRRIGLPELRPHAFRHACGAELLDRTGGDLRSVQEHLRHASIQTTTIYTHVSKPKLQKVVSLLDPDELSGRQGDREV